MENRVTLLVVFVYTLGVLVTGLWVAVPSWPALNPFQICLLGALGILWTVYFDRVVVPRIINLETEDEEDEEETAESADAGATAESEQAG